MRNAGIVFDLPLGKGSPAEEATDLFDRNSRIKDAVKQAENLSNNRMITQDVLREIEEDLPMEDRYAFHMALVDADIRVRTGGRVERRPVMDQSNRAAAVNVVDREEPVVKDLGDAFVNSENLWTGVPSIPRDELNTDPSGTTELDYGKPRRSEGEKHEGFGNNLTDLTMTSSLSVASFSRSAQGYGEGAFAVPIEDVVMLLNHAVGLEYSQALRYNIYADTLRVAFREALAGEFEDHAEEELEHAKALSSKIISLGGALSPKIVEPVRIPPNDPGLVNRILRELWKHEQEGIKFYRSLKKSLGANIFVHYIEEVLVAESEHVDDLMRFSVMPKSAEVLPLPSSPNQSQPAQWAESYSDENQFEGLDKLGEAELGKCPHCESDEVLGQSCEQCSGKKASCVRALCEQCDGFGFVKVCLLCGNEWAPPPTLSASRVATWQRRAGHVRRKTMYGEIPVWIEYEAGDVKRGKSREGVEWERKMQAAYGFVPGTRGADGEPVDVYLGGSPSRKVYVVSQMRPGGGFDEEKAMFGFPNEQQAEATYRSHMPHNGDKHFGGIREMTVGEFEGDYMRSDAASPYKPALQLRQFQLTGQKMVPNPNPKGREDQVTEEYAEQWKRDNGGGSPPTESGDDSAFQKFKQDKSKGKKKPDAPAAGESDSVFTKFKQDKSKQPAAPAEARPSEAPEQVETPKAKEPPAATEPAKEAPTEPDAPVDSTQALKDSYERYHGKPMQPAAKPKPKAPVKVDDSVKQKPLMNVDTSRAVSPIEEQDRKDTGKAKELEMNFWRLLGGPGFNPYKTSVRDLHRLAKRVIAESYSQPDHGPLGTDGEPDHPVEDNVVKGASLMSEADWSFNVRSAFFMEREARGDLVKVQGPTGWIGLVSKETMAKEPGKYVPVRDEPAAPAPARGRTKTPKKSEGLVTPVTVESAQKEVLPAPRQWLPERPANMPSESWKEHFDGDPKKGGKPTAERARLHEQIIAEELNRVPPVAPGEQKIAIMTMGGPASGKTTMLGGIDKTNFVSVDPDNLKEKIPEYKIGTDPKASWRGTAFCVHNESSYLGDVLQERAMKQGKHMIIDGTGANAENFEAAMRSLKEHGYKVKIYMPDLDVDVALTRVSQRADKTGRFVPDEIVRNAYNKIPQNFERLAKQADEAHMFDARRVIPSADGKVRPRLVWSMGPKGEQHHDKAFVAKFKSRATGGQVLHTQPTQPNTSVNPNAPAKPGTPV